MNLGFSKSSKTILLSAVAFLLISVLVGFVGMMVMWTLAPLIVSIGIDVPLSFIEETTNTESFLKLRNAISIMGWFFSFIPMFFWVWQVMKDYELPQQTFQKVEDK